MKNKFKIDRALGWRLLMTMTGVLICAFSVAVFQKSAFGVDPFQCLSRGLHTIFKEKMSYGMFYMLWSIVLLVIDLFLDRKKMGLATFVNLFFMGYMVDGSYFLIDKMFPNPGLGIRIVMLFFAVVIMCLGSSFYFTSNLGVSVYDAISLSLSEKPLKIGSKIIPFKFIRIVSDCICVLVGFLFGVIPGLGTIITAFFMGPLISWFNVYVAEPILKRHLN